MDIKKIISKIGNFAKHHWLFLLLYAIIFIVIIIGVNLHVTDKVKSSKEEIESITSNLYESENGYCFREVQSYTLVQYKLMEKPSIEDMDSSAYEQMYGKANYYYVATNSPWNIIQYIKEQSGFISAYRIEPHAVALERRVSTSPGMEFRKLYDFTIKEFDVRVKDKSPEEIKTDFHFIIKSTSFVFLGPSISWFTFNSNKLFLERSFSDVYMVKEDSDKIELYRYGGVALFIFLETILFILFWYFKRNLKKIKSKLKALDYYLDPHNKETIIAENGLTDTEYEVLLQKINPINFMTPYDAEKIKIANDLYSALLKSRDNETIIKMIEEKAKRELNI